MRILIYGINFSPELIGIGKYTGEMALWLAERGHQVYVITAPPYYPAWQVQSPYCAWQYRHETPAANLSVFRCPVWVPRKRGGFARVLHLLSFALSSLLPMLWSAMRRPDLILTIAPPLFGAPAAYLTARLAGGKAWLHIQDFEVDAAFDLGLFKFNFLKHPVFVLESRLMRRFDKVSSISQKMVEKLHKKNIASKCRVLFPNWVDTRRIYPLTTPTLLRSAWGIDFDKLVLLYSGNMGAKQGLEIIIEAAKRLQKDKRFVFVLCGTGACHAQLQTLAGDAQNIIWRPLQAVDRLNDLLNTADIHLLPQRADAADLVMPSKLTGMLASGRPVIATVAQGTQIAEVVKHGGLITQPGDVQALIKAILELADNPALRKRLGRAARVYAMSYMDKDAVLQGFEREISSFYD